MRALIKNELRRSRRHLFIWLGIMFLLIGFCYYEYLSLKDSLGEVALMLSGMPRLLTTMFGVKGDFNTALGWYSCIYFWVSILAFVYALNLGTSCIAKEVKNGTSAYLFTKPVCRTEILLSKIIASAVNLLMFSAFSGLCNYVLLILPTGGLEQPAAALTTTIGLYLTQLMFFFVGLLISSIVKKYKAAVQVGTVFLLTSYFLAITAQYSGIRFLDLLSPLRYFDVYEVTLNGIRIFSLVLAFLIMAICIFITAMQWKKREV